MVREMDVMYITQRRRAWFRGTPGTAPRPGEATQRPRARVRRTQGNTTRSGGAGGVRSRPFGNRVDGNRFPRTGGAALRTAALWGGSALSPVSHSAAPAPPSRMCPAPGRPCSVPGGASPCGKPLPGRPLDGPRPQDPRRSEGAQRQGRTVTGFRAVQWCVDVPCLLPGVRSCWRSVSGMELRAESAQHRVRPVGWLSSDLDRFEYGRTDPRAGRPVGGTGPGSAPARHPEGDIPPSARTVSANAGQVRGHPNRSAFRSCAAAARGRTGPAERAGAGAARGSRGITWPPLVVPSAGRVVSAQPQPAQRRAFVPGRSRPARPHHPASRRRPLADVSYPAGCRMWMAARAAPASSG